MSYYIYVSADGCCDSHDHNITSNFLALWQALGLDDVLIQAPQAVGESAEPIQAGTALPLLIRAIHRIDQDLGDLNEHVESNGDWGTLPQARDVIWDVALDCAKHPDAQVHRSG